MEHTEKRPYSKYAEVALDAPLDRPLDYGIPACFLESADSGSHVKVHLRGKLRDGYIVSIKESSSFANVLPLHEVISSAALSPDLIRLALWISTYYATPLSKVLKVMLPSSVRHNMAHKEQFFVMRGKTKEVLREKYKELCEESPSQAKILEVLLMTKKGMLLTELLEKANVSRSPVDTLVKKGLLSIDLVRIDRSPLINEEYFKTFPKKLNEEQTQAFEAISHTISTGEFKTHLLFGITGSGKTEVYLQAIETALSLGKGTVMLVPEISLTAQTIERFRTRFEENIAVLHHRLSHGERLDEWHRLKRGEAKIAIGARSALFSPVQNLGLIIVDEEHDTAYKQSEEMPCYNARDVAVMRGKLSNATVILGSATPSVESYTNAVSKKYDLHLLSKRASEAHLPKITIVDMKREYEKQRGFTSFSDPLLEGIKKRLSQGEQVILFLNRRGYNTSLLCKGCGHTFKCNDCDLPLTYHLEENILSCHLCNFHLAPPSSCPTCSSKDTLKYKGVGTEQIERALHSIFPECRTIRVDSDTTKHKGSHEMLFRSFSTGKGDILIGTQMVSKGLHFPGVTLVGVLNPDSALHIPDFRSGERVFQLITQVSGRAGRGESPGEVIIQTLVPENPIINLAAKNDFENFYREEMSARTAFGYPPLSHFVKFLFEGESENITQEIGSRFRSELIRLSGKGYIIHPLVPPGHPKIKGEFRFQFLARGKPIVPLVESAKKIVQNFSLPKGVRLTIDVDPVYTFF